MIQKLIIKIAKFLNKNNVSYMLIGGQAVLLYGGVRLTEDIDVVLGVDTNSLRKIKNILRQMGLVIPKNIDDSFVKKTNVLVGVDRITGIRIDFIFSFTPYERQALRRATRIKLNNYNVNFASCEDTIIHKMFARRPRDLEDIRILLAKNINRLDIGYTKRWLREFSKVVGSDLVKELDKILKSIR